MVQSDQKNEDLLKRLEKEQTLRVKFELQLEGMKNWLEKTIAEKEELYTKLKSKDKELDNLK